MQGEWYWIGIGTSINKNRGVIIKNGGILIDMLQGSHVKWLQRNKRFRGCHVICLLNWSTKDNSHSVTFNYLQGSLDSVPIKCVGENGSNKNLLFFDYLVFSISLSFVWNISNTRLVYDSQSHNIFAMCKHHVITFLV